MKILAIWERREAHPKYGGIFCLMADGSLKNIRLETESDGVNAEGIPRYVETGHLEITDAFEETPDWTFEKADYFIKHFGGHVVYKEGQ